MWRSGRNAAGNFAGNMRVTIPITNAGPINWHALDDVHVFLFRRIADQERDLLFVDALYDVGSPEFIGDRAKDWYFGHVCYAPIDPLEQLNSRHSDRSGIPLQQWSVPRWVIEWEHGKVLLHAFSNDVGPASEFCDRIFGGSPGESAPPARLKWELSTSRDQYLLQAEKLLHHIQRGDIYEVNYCVERSADAADLDPYTAFAKMLDRTEASFAAFHRSGDRFALCASPERFLSFNGTMVFSQPMKGTRHRSKDASEDARLAKELATDGKERSENIMALDVSRHDLSRIAASGSVKVEELCAVRAHGQVHQMTSTVSARIRNGLTPIDVLRASFPMASMTGAPKFRAMQLIDAMEDQARGLFSGTLGFFAPDGTGDFNVVIRALFFDRATNRATLLTGSALTAACDPGKEWEECELKARSVINALQ